MDAKQMTPQQQRTQIIRTAHPIDQKTAERALWNVTLADGSTDQFACSTRAAVAIQDLGYEIRCASVITNYDAA